MIRSITVDSLSNGHSVKMVLANPEISQGFAVTNCNGIGPGQAKVSDSELVTVDGSIINSARLSSRSISIDLRFVPTSYDEGVADVRRKTYIYFPIKKMVRLTFEFQDFKPRTTIRRRWIEGIVEKNEPNIWSDEEGCSIVIRCGDPYFRDTEVEEDSFSMIDPKFHFEFPDEYQDHPFPISEILTFTEKTLTNNSTIEVGAIFKLESSAAVVNPGVYNVTTNQRFDLEYTLRPGEVIIIDTRKGHKRIYVQDGYDTNMIRYLKAGSKWLQLAPGANRVGYQADSGVENLVLSYKIEPVYEGI